jgi:TFIIF-interacting CTD phosphatase-like protein
MQEREQQRGEREKLQRQVSHPTKKKKTLINKQTNTGEEPQVETSAPATTQNKEGK